MSIGKAAFVGFGEVNSDFEYISERADEALAAAKRAGIQIVCDAFVIDDEAKEYEQKAAAMLKEGGFDMVIVCLAGWVPTHTVICTIECVRHLPMLVWGVGGRTQGGRMVTPAAQAGTTALRYPMEMLGYDFLYMYDHPDSEPDIARIAQFAKAASAKARLAACHVGQIGYRDMRLYGTMFDGLLLKRQLGVEMEFAEMLEVAQREAQASREEVETIKAQIQQDWAFEREADDAALEKGIRSFIAIRDIMKEKEWEGISIIDVDGMKKLAGNPPSLIFMLIGKYLEAPTVPENDSLGLVTQMICKYLTGQISHYMEFYDFYPDTMLMGVPDYIPPQAVKGEFAVSPNRFGLLSECVLGTAKVKDGQCTICRLFENGSGYSMHIALCDARQPRPWEELGWDPPAPQLPSLEMAVQTCSVDEFAQKVTSQHYIVTYGDNRGLLEDFCKLCDIRTVY